MFAEQTFPIYLIFMLIIFTPSEQSGRHNRSRGNFTQGYHSNRTRGAFGRGRGSGNTSNVGNQQRGQSVPALRPPAGPATSSSILGAPPSTPSPSIRGPPPGSHPAGARRAPRPNQNQPAVSAQGTNYTTTMPRLVLDQTSNQWKVLSSEQIPGAIQVRDEGTNQNMYLSDLPDMRGNAYFGQPSYSSQQHQYPPYTSGNVVHNPSVGTSAQPVEEIRGGTLDFSWHGSTSTNIAQDAARRIASGEIVNLQGYNVQYFARSGGSSSSSQNQQGSSTRKSATDTIGRRHQTK